MKENMWYHLANNLTNQLSEEMKMARQELGLSMLNEDLEHIMEYSFHDGVEDILGMTRRGYEEWKRKRDQEAEQEAWAWYEEATEEDIYF
jgi:hypothetical protein